MTEVTRHSARQASDQISSVLADVVRRVVEVAAPDKVILFGSAARGDAGPDSDLDLLVVVPGPVHRGRLAEAIYMSLIGVGHPVDVIVVTPEDLDRYRNTPCLVIQPALQEGCVVYDRSAAPTR